MWRTMFSTITTAPSTTIPKSNAPRDSRFAGIPFRLRHVAANNNAKLVPHLSHKVELTGDVTEKGGTMTIAATNLKMISK